MHLTRVVLMVPFLASVANAYSACIATCTGKRLGSDGKPHTGQRFLNINTCRTLSPDCSTQFAGTGAGYSMEAACGLASDAMEFHEFRFPTIDLCDSFTRNIMAPIIPQQGSSTKPQYAEQPEVQKNASCGCQEMVQEMLAQIDGSSVSTSGGFCDYLKDRVKNIGTNSVCKNPVTSALPIVGSLCDYVVGEVADAVDNAVVGPAFDPFCGEIVSVAKKDFDVDLDRSFVAAKDITANLAGHLCGNYLCPGQTDVCKVVTGARDGAIKLASVVCTLLGGAKNMANIAGALCFPATASVTLENGSQKMMKDIQIGDRVKIGKDRYSEVFMWTHRLEHIITDFVKIIHDHGELILTAGHYLYANGQILPANSVKIGDQIPLHDGSMSTIRSITTSTANGLYNPQTRDGDIAVNGVVTTTYTTVAHPVVAKGFLLVMRTIPSLARRLLGNRIVSVNVIPSWASGIIGFLPAGTK